MDTKQLQNSQTWAQATFGGCDLGHQARTKRLVKTAWHLAREPQKSLSAACPDDAERLGAHRLMESDEVDPQAISKGGFRATKEQLTDCSLILVSSDTTAPNFPHATVREEMGEIGGPAEHNSRGCLAHSSLAIDAESGLTMGLIDQVWWRRDPVERGRKHDRKQRPYEQKESFKWQAASERIESRMGEMMERVIELNDAEADIYEYLQHKEQGGHRYIVRISQDRALSDDDRRLWKHLADQPELTRMRVHVPQKGGRKEREATVSLRSSTMRLRPPWRGDRKLAALEVSAVLVEEVDPPEGVEPLCWRLYTSEPVATAEQVKTVARYYSYRWRVEEFHRAWKSGCGLEDLRQQTVANIERVGRTLAFVAVRLLQLREHARYRPDEPCERVLERDQWQCLWLSTENEPLPPTPPASRWAFYALARLGGFYDSKGTGRVGTEALHRGWQRLTDLLLGYRLAHHHGNF